MHAHNYHRRELPQVSFVSRQSTSFVATEHVFCRDRARLLSRQSTSFVATEHVFCRDRARLLSRQSTSFVATEHVFCCDRARLLSRQSTSFVATEHVFCRDRARLLSRQSTSFVATEHVFCHDRERLLSRQKYTCRDKVAPKHFCRDRNFPDKIMFVATNTSFVATDTSFVATKVCLSWQNLHVCRDKNIFRDKVQKFSRGKPAFVATNDTCGSSRQLYITMHYAGQWGSQFCLRTGHWCFDQYWIIAVVWYVLRWP